MDIARQKLQKNFGHAATDYDARAQFQHVQTRRVLDAARMLLPLGARMVDVGCGTGYLAHIAYEKNADWNIIGVDIAPGMCAVARARCTVIAGDAAALPLADGAVDAVVSSLCYQWVENQAQAFTELARVLKPGGRAIIASLGAASLRELRSCADATAVTLSLLPMRTLEATKTALLEAGLEINLADARNSTEYYPSVAALMDSMRSIGAGNNFSNHSHGFLSPKRWAAMVAAYEVKRTPLGIPATWEHHFFVLSKQA